MRSLSTGVLAVGMAGTTVKLNDAVVACFTLGVLVNFFPNRVIATDLFEVVE